MKIDLMPGEKLIREGAANLQRGWESVGGRLFLTDRRLAFRSHMFNIQSGPTEIPISTITAFRPCSTKFLGFLPVSSNSLAVSSGGTEFRFVLFNREEWAAAIDDQVARLRA